MEPSPLARTQARDPMFEDELDRTVSGPAHPRLISMLNLLEKEKEAENEELKKMGGENSSVKKSILERTYTNVEPMQSKLLDLLSQRADSESVTEYDPILSDPPPKELVHTSLTSVFSMRADAQPYVPNSPLVGVSGIQQPWFLHDNFDILQQIPDIQIQNSLRLVQRLTVNQNPQPKLDIDAPQVEIPDLYFHEDAAKVGSVWKSGNCFTKNRRGGSISLVYEKFLRTRGVHNYQYIVEKGRLAPSDGIGFVFGPRCPCAKNITLLWTIFVNRHGVVSKRLGQTLIREPKASLHELSIGSPIVISVDLNSYKIIFASSNASGHWRARSVDFSDIASHVDCTSGYLCCVVTHTDVSASLDVPDPLFVKSLEDQLPSGTSSASFIEQS